MDRKPELLLFSFMKKIFINFLLMFLLFYFQTKINDVSVLYLWEYGRDDIFLFFVLISILLMTNNTEKLLLWLLLLHIYIFNEVFETSILLILMVCVLFWSCKSLKNKLWTHVFCQIFNTCIFYFKCGLYINFLENVLITTNFALF